MPLYPPAALVTPVDQFQLATGETTLPRMLVTLSTNLVVAGNLVLTYFTARRTEPITNAKTYSGTGAVATPTLCRFGVYSEAANGDITLVEACANDTTLWAGANTGYSKAFSNSWVKTAGQRYAFAVLVVSGSAGPSFYGTNVINSPTGSGIYGALPPRLCGQVTGQSDLPSSVVSASIVNTASPRPVHAELT